jgi:hypothetical protein
LSGSSEYSSKVSRIHSTPFDGNCVTISGNDLSTTLIYKTMQCKERLPIVCIGNVFFEKPMAKNIPEMPRNDLNEFGYRLPMKYHKCETDVIH